MVVQYSKENTLTFQAGVVRFMLWQASLWEEPLNQQLPSNETISTCGLKWAISLSHIFKFEYFGGPQWKQLCRISQNNYINFKKIDPSHFWFFLFIFCSIYCFYCLYRTCSIIQKLHMEGGKKRKFSGIPLRSIKLLQGCVLFYFGYFNIQIQRKYRQNLHQKIRTSIECEEKLGFLHRLVEVVWNQ